MFYGKHAFGEFWPEADHHGVLAVRLATLVRTGVLAEERSTADGAGVLRTDQ